jgi:hypothetical protein
MAAEVLMVVTNPIQLLAAGFLNRFNALENVPAFSPAKARSNLHP